MAVISANPNNNTLRMPNRRDEQDELTQSFIAMLNVMRRCYELWGDPEIKRIIDKAERSLAHR